MLTYPTARLHVDDEGVPMGDSELLTIVEAAEVVRVPVATLRS